MSERPAVPLPRDPDAIVMPTADEHAAILAMFHAVEALKALGWREAIYAPDDESRLLLIKVGSTGIYRGYRDKQRNFWTYDGDIWPSRPAMFKKDGTR